MPDLSLILRSAPADKFEGVVYRVCPALYRENVVSMRGSYLHGARYNIRGYFGALYTSITADTARREAERYFTVPPKSGFVEASIELRLTRVVDLTKTALLRRVGIVRQRLTSSSYSVPQEIGLRAWENGIEGLLVPSAADRGKRNLTVFLDNQRPVWRVELRHLTER